MSFDGMFTHALIKELNTTFAGGRIHKIQQPYEMELVLTIRANRKNHKLLISAHPSFGRIQVTEQAYNNPETPPNFTMVLRKYVEGDRKSTRLNSSHVSISYAVFCLKKKNNTTIHYT